MPVTCDASKRSNSAFRVIATAVWGGRKRGSPPPDVWKKERIMRFTGGGKEEMAVSSFASHQIKEESGKHRSGNIFSWPMERLAEKGLLDDVQLGLGL